MSPRNEEYKRMLYEKGQAAGPGERVEITSLKFKSDAIIVDFNGGPYAKHRFLSHIEINDIQLAPTGAPATGFRITLAFEGGVPAVSAAEVKALLDPMVDFKAKSSVEAYTNTLAPKVKLAVESHDILVGMDRQMVLASVGPPASRHRERTASTSETASGYNYEEWIYGQTPEPIRFVRFRNGRVVRLEIAEIGKPIEVHDKNEMGNAAEPALLARTISNGDAQPTAEGDQHAAHPPTLRKPGEVIEGASNVGKVRMPDDPDAPPKALPPAAPNPDLPPRIRCKLVGEPVQGLRPSFLLFGPALQPRPWIPQQGRPAFSLRRQGQATYLFQGEFNMAKIAKTGDRRKGHGYTEEHRLSQVLQAHSHRQAREGPRARRSRRSLYLLLGLRLLRKALSSSHAVILSRRQG